jgi:hypothetical protein
MTVFVLRLLGAIGSSAAFGLIAALAWSPWNFWGAVGLGFLYGTAFVMGTGYRILITFARRQASPSPASWSGATVGATIGALLLWLLAVAQKGDADFVLLALGIAINLAYLPIKSACRIKDCCAATVDLRGIDLRFAEIAATCLVLLVAGAIAVSGQVALAAVIAIAGHLVVRLLSRRLRGRGSWGWPPLVQPGAELAPLTLALVVSTLGLMAGS